MIKPYDLAYLGNPILKQRAQEVQDPTSKETQEIVDRMIATAEQKFGGVDNMAGFAAPQCNVPYQIFLFQSSGRRGGDDIVPLTAVINPIITFRSDEKGLDYEGCFSLPLILQRNVPRSTRIECEYTTLEGELIKRELKGFAARVFQHEYGHLIGKLAIDFTDDIIFPGDDYQEDNSKFRTLEEVLGIKTGKELSENFTFNTEKGEYERKE